MNKVIFRAIVAQRPTKFISKEEIAESFQNFERKIKPILAQTCHIKKEDIVAESKYNTHTREYQGYIEVPKTISENTADSLYYTLKTIWRSQKTEPYDFFLQQEIADPIGCSPHGL